MDWWVSRRRAAAVAARHNDTRTPKFHMAERCSAVRLLAYALPAIALALLPIGIAHADPTFNGSKGDRDARAYGADTGLNDPAGYAQIVCRMRASGLSEHETINMNVTGLHGEHERNVTGQDVLLVLAAEYHFCPQYYGGADQSAAPQPAQVASPTVPGLVQGSVLRQTCSNYSRYIFGVGRDGTPMACVSDGVSSTGTWVRSQPVAGVQVIGASCNPSFAAQSPDGRPLVCGDRGWTPGR